MAVPLIMSWLRLCYRKFIHKFADMSRSLNNATTKSAPTKIVWTEKMNVDFCSLRDSLCDVGVLTVPVESDVFLLQTDESGVGTSGVLSISRDGEELPVGFFSRQLKDAETRYSARELECLAVVDSIRHFEVYLHGRHFRVETDHKALEGLFTSKVLNRHLTRWA